jgi:hypothetical protein
MDDIRKPSKGYVDVTERPDLYDWFYTEQVEDIPMYLSLAEGHSEVLECGIGSGRIAIPFAQSGKVVYGIDNSAAMLRRLESNLSHFPKTVQENIHAYEADMRGFDLGRRFSFVLVPFSTFNYLLSIEDQKASLRAIRDHLIEQGTLVLELLSFSLFPHWLDNDTAIRKVVKRIDPNTGGAIEMWRAIRFDSATQIVEQDRHFRFYSADGVFDSEVIVLWRNRFFFMGEMQLLLETAGFEIANIYGDCSFGPYRHESEFAVVVAKSRI